MRLPLLLLVLAACNPYEGTLSSPHLLEAGDPVSGSLDCGGEHFYEVHSDADFAVTLEADDGVLDLTCRVFLDEDTLEQDVAAFADCGGASAVASTTEAIRVAGAGSDVFYLRLDLPQLLDGCSEDYTITVE